MRTWLKNNYLYYKYNTDIVKFYEFLQKSQYWSLGDIESYQREKMKAMIQFAYCHVPFYKNFFDKLKISPRDINSVDDLKILPIIRRQDLIENLNQFRSSNFKKYNPIKRFTSGTTGNPLLFYIDKKVWGHGWARKLRSWEWGGYELDDKIGVLAGGSLVPDNSNKLNNRTVWQWLNNFYPLPITHLDEKIISEHLEYIIKKNIKILRGYPSALYSVARYMEQNKIRIPLKLIITTAEVLYEQQRNLIEKVFETKIYDNYGCADGQGNANECGFNNGLHFSSETALLEIVDKDNEEVEAGEEGEIVLTSFFNYSLPFIRYAPGDLAIKSSIDKCGCGKSLPLIEKIIGRSSDQIVLANGRILNGLSLPLEYLKIKKFQIVQQSENRVDVKIIQGNASENDIANVYNVVKSHCGEEVEVNILIVDDIPVPMSGKFRFIISNMD